MFNMKGDTTATLQALMANGPSYVVKMIPHFSWDAAKYLGAFATFEAFLLMFMPGKTFRGPITAGGNTPVYKARSAACCTPVFYNFIHAPFEKCVLLLTSWKRAWTSKLAACIGRRPSHPDNYRRRTESSASSRRSWSTSASGGAPLFKYQLQKITTSLASILTHSILLSTGSAT